MVKQGRPGPASRKVRGPAGFIAGDEEWRLSGGSRKLLLLVHLVAAVGFLVGALSVMVLVLAGMNGRNAIAVYPAAQMLCTWLVMPLAVAALVTGILQAALSPWGVGRYWWIAIKMVITLILTIILFATLYPRIADAAATALGHSAGPLASGQRTRIAISWPAVCGLLIVNMVMGIYKPPWRLNRRRSRPDARVHARMPSQ